MSELAEKPSTNPESDSEFALITSWEYKRILRVAGYSYPEVARGIGMSRGYVANVANGLRPITMRQVQQLRHFLGPRLYNAALQKVRRDRIAEDQRRREHAERFRLQEQQQREAEAARARMERESRAQRIESELTEQQDSLPDTAHPAADDTSL